MASFSSIINAALAKQNFTGLDLLIESGDISRIEKIEALELAGAGILSDTRHTLLFPKAFDYWRKSLHLRSTDTDGCGPIIKKLPENLKKTGRIAEWTTAEELERVILNHYTVNKLFTEYIDRYHKRPVEEEIRDVDWLHIQWSMLEIIRHFDPSENGLWRKTLIVVQDLMQTLSKIGQLNDPLLNANTIEVSLNLILATDQYHLKDREFVHDGLLFWSFMSMFKFVEMLAKKPQLINEDSMASLSQLVPRNERCNPVRYGMLLLHKACEDWKLAIVDLLLRAGADPNAGDKYDYRPLHYLAMFYPHNDAVAQLMLDYGAHLDLVNNERKTPAQVWTKRHAKGRQSMPGWLREDSAPKLMCLCARVIRSNRVPYAKLPPSLHPFVAMH